jgi:hypothetical protein
VRATGTWKAACALSAVLWGISLPAPALAKDFVRRVRFGRGRSTAVLTGAVARGDRDRYVLGAKAGQTMRASITAREKNAVFTIYQPGGNPLPGTEEGTDRTRWSGRLPKSGDYTISVGGTRGNAGYTLRVTVR